MRISSDALDRIAQNLNQTHLAVPALWRLNRAGIDWIGLKGLGLLAQQSPNADRRPLADFDLWIRAEDLSLCADLLEQSGFTRVAAGQHCFRRRHGIAVSQIELHHELDGMTESAQRLIWNRSELQELQTSPGSRPDPARAPRLRVRVPNPTDHFLLIAHHAFVGHGYLRDYWRDDLLGLAPTLDPDELRARAAELELRPILAMACEKLQSYEVLPEHLSALAWEDLTPKEHLRAEILTELQGSREIPNLGHVLHWIAAPSWKLRWQTLTRLFFPDDDFLARRLEAEGQPDAPPRGRPKTGARFLRYWHSFRAASRLGRRWISSRGETADERI